jgi:hypothetical protein
MESTVVSGALQLTVKRRQKPEGFLDTLNDEYKKYVTGERNLDDKLKRLVEEWLVEDEVLDSPALGEETISPFQIAATIMKRICQIAGHAWLEFSDDDAPIMASLVNSRGEINSYLAEFIPELEPDVILESFDTLDGGDVRWQDVANQHLVKLFAHLLDGSSVKTPLNNRSKRPAAGEIGGFMSIVSPDQLREYSESWFADRAGAYVTPAWRIKGSRQPLDIVRQIPSGSRYSFTPEYYPESDNCVTWASRTLDRISPPNWLETIRIQCQITADLVQERCEDYHIKDEGRVRCVTLYAFAADKHRRTVGLRSFK